MKINLLALMITGLGGLSFVSGQQTQGLLVSGVVIDSISGGGVDDATVVATPLQLGQAEVAVLTDLRGGFSFSNLSRGGYRLTVTKTGYLVGGYGQTSPSGSSMPLTVAGSRSDLQIRLWRAASIEGRVIDATGEPTVGVQVVALRRTFPGGRSRLLVTGLVKTDDRGRYRLSGLVPGFYNVLVPAVTCTLPTRMLQSLFAEPSGGYAALQRELIAAGIPFLPPGEPGTMVQGDLTVLTQPGLAAGLFAGADTTSYEAATYPLSLIPFSVTAAQTPDLALTFRTTDAGDVVGFVKDLNGQPVPGALLSLTKKSAFELGGDRVRTAMTLTEPSGRFRFARIPTGDYVVTNTLASQGNSSGTAPAKFVFSTVNVSSGTETLSLVAESAHSLTGRVAVVGKSGNETPDNVTLVTVFLERTDGLPVTMRLETRPNSEGVFTIRSIPPGQYFVRATTPQGLFLSASSLDGKDFSWTPIAMERDMSGLVVELVTKQNLVSGTVLPEPGVRSLGTVYVFPVEQSLWMDFGSNPRRIRTVTADSNGAYALSGLPAGDYFFAAVPPGLYDPETEPRLWFRLLSTLATRSSVRADIDTVVNLQMVRPK